MNHNSQPSSDSNGDSNTAPSSASKTSTYQLMNLLLSRLQQGNSTESHTSSTSIAFAAENSIQTALKETQTDIAILTQLQTALEAQLRRKKAEEMGLYRSLSPLLSLDLPILQIMTSYLDEEGLWALEESSPKLFNPRWNTFQWEDLDQKRRTKYKSKAELSPKHRGIRYAKAVKFARTMEDSAKVHYSCIDSNLQSTSTFHEWPNRLFTALDFERSWRSLTGKEGEFFIRISYTLSSTDSQENDNDSSDNNQTTNTNTNTQSANNNNNTSSIIIFEGFQHKCVAEFNDGNYIAFYWKHLFPKLAKATGIQESEFMNGTDQWSIEMLQRFASQLNITILFYDFDDTGGHGGNNNNDGNIQLIIATSGFDSLRHGRLMLPPRSPLAHVKQVDLEDCAMASVRCVEDSQLILLLEWGDYNAV